MSPQQHQPAWKQEARHEPPASAPEGAPEKPDTGTPDSTTETPTDTPSESGDTADAPPPVPERRVNVLFLNLPFASATRPGIGVSLLQAQLLPMGITSRIEYLNLRFARQFGAADYEYLADRTPSPMLAGDWVFSRCAFGRRDDADADYLRISDERFGHLPPTRRGLAAWFASLRKPEVLP